MVYLIDNDGKTLFYIGGSYGAKRGEGIVFLQTRRS
jgi:hypothetical protein